MGRKQLKEEISAAVILKTGCFYNVDSVAIINGLSRAVQNSNLKVLYCLAYTADDDS